MSGGLGFGVFLVGVGCLLGLGFFVCLVGLLCFFFVLLFILFYGWFEFVLFFLNVFDLGNKISRFSFCVTDMLGTSGNICTCTRFSVYSSEYLVESC